MLSFGLRYGHAGVSRASRREVSMTSREDEDVMRVLGTCLEETESQTISLNDDLKKMLFATDSGNGNQSCFTVTKLTMAADVLLGLRNL